MTGYDAIPGELKERAQWVCWKKATRNGKSTKIPKQPDGSGNAKSNDSDTWGTFKRAVKTATELEDWGIGYMFAEDGPYLGIDLDACVSERGGPADWLPSLTPLLEDTYIEHSPSGTGLHVILRDVDRPDWWTNCEEDLAGDVHRGVEVYDSGRFFTFTGEALDVTSSTISEFDNGTFRDWLLDAWNVFNDDPPRLPGDDNEESVTHAAGSSADEIDLSIHDVVTGYGEGVRNEHPFHGSSTGSNFMVDEGGETFRCWRHGVTGNGLHLVGIEQGIISCGDWERGLDSETWAEILKAGRESGYDIPEARPTDSRVMAEEADNWDTVTWMYTNPEIQNKDARYAAFRRLMDESEFMTAEDTGIIYVYDDDSGVFRDQGKQVIENTVQQQLGSAYTQHERQEILGHVRARTYADRDTFDAGEHDAELLCVRNGIIDLNKRELVDHDPEYRFTRALPVEYNPSADADAIDQFLDDITRREEDKRTMYEMIGNCLLPHYDYASFLILFGEGANGKSTFFDVVEALLGEDHVSGWGLQDLEDNRFATSSLPGKFANIAPDLPSRSVTQTGTIKALSGGDTMMAEEKGQPAFEFVNTAKLMFGANRPPVIQERSNAIMRRLLPIHLPFQFTNEDDGNPDARPRQELLRELTTSEELSGLLNLALDGLDRLREDGRFSLPEPPEERLEFYEQFSDPIKEFAMNCLKNEQDKTLPKSSVYEVYKRFSEANDYSIRSRAVFFRQLRQTSFTYTEARLRNEDGRVRSLKTATLTDDGMDYCTNPFLSELGLNATDDESGEETTVTPIEAIQPEGNPFYTVEVQVDGIRESTNGGPAYKGTVSDETGTLELIDWEGVPNLNDVDEDKTYRVVDVKAAYDSSGTLYLEPVQNTTKWSMITAPRPEGQSALPKGPDVTTSNSRSDGTETDTQNDEAPSQSEVRSRLDTIVRENQDAGDGPGVISTDVVDALVEYNVGRETAKHEVEQALRDVRLHEPVSGHLRRT